MTIYLDISTSYAWRRNPVGVVRVEREFAKNLRNQLPGMRFCRFDANTSMRILMRDSEVDLVLGDSWCAQTVEPERVSARTELASRLTAAARHVLPRALFQGAKMLLGGLGHETTDPKGRAQASGANVPAAPPGLSVGDVFVSVGADWDHLPPEQVRAIKQETGCKVVLACYDTIVVDFPEYSISDEFASRLREHLLGLGTNADLVVTISESTKRDVLRLWDKERTDSPVCAVSAVPLASALPPVGGADPSRSARLEEFRRGGPYVIYVSTLEARKNHRLLFNLWREFHAAFRGEVPRLLLVGARGWGVDDLLAELARSQAGRDGYIQFWSDVDDELLQSLYAGCEFGVFPSFYEGWGLAAAELLAFGKTCVVSTGSSLQEATQNLCPSYHPCDHLGWRDEILRLSRDQAYRLQHERAIASSFRPRTWADCSAEFAAKLRAVADESALALRG